MSSGRKKYVNQSLFSTVAIKIYFCKKHYFSTSRKKLFVKQDKLRNKESCCIDICVVHLTCSRMALNDFASYSTAPKQSYGNSLFSRMT